MTNPFRFKPLITRREFAVGAASLVLQPSMTIRAQGADAQSLDERFDSLNRHGNSTCSAVFTDSISKMPVTARLQGSCCSPMERHRYGEQIQGLTKYGAIPEIPPDPYDIAAGTAQKAMRYYDLTLSPDEEKAYQYAMQNSDVKGPCCCQCWRWRTYGGLAKFLIREHRFTGEQLVEVWNLSGACGGAEDHHG